MAQLEQELSRMTQTIQRLEHKQDELSRLVNQILISIRDQDRAGSEVQNVITQELAHIDRQVTILSARLEQLDANLFSTAE